MIPKIVGYIGLRPRGSLRDVAMLLQEALSVQLRADTQGRYEECPAFMGQVLGMDVALLGVPEPEYDLRENPTKDFTLQVMSTVSGSEGEVDLSEFFVKLIKERTDLECWVLT